MNINFYVKRQKSENDLSFGQSYKDWHETGESLKESINNLFEELQ